MALKTCEMSSRWLWNSYFLPKTYKNCLAARGFTPHPRVCNFWVVPVYSVRHLNETFFEQKCFNFDFKPPSPPCKILVAYLAALCTLHFAACAIAVLTAGSKGFQVETWAISNQSTLFRSKVTKWKIQCKSSISFSYKSTLLGGVLHSWRLNWCTNKTLGWSKTNKPIPWRGLPVAKSFQSKIRWSIIFYLVQFRNYFIWTSSTHFTWGRRRNCPIPI